jgi:serine phosphatase RsbU (regulator of sigma subunit)
MTSPVGPYTVLVLIPIFLMALAITIYYINRRSLTNRLFALFLTAGFCWMFIGYLFYIDETLLHRLLPVQMAIGSFLGALFYLFTRAFVDERYRVRRWSYAAFLPSIAIAAVCLAVELSPPLFADFRATAAIVDGRMVRQPSLLYTLYTVTILTGFIAGIVILARGYVVEKAPEARRRIGITLLSVFLSLGGALVMTNVMTLLGMGGYDRLALIMIFLGILGISFSILRHRAWTIESLLDIIARRNREIEEELETARLLQRRLLPGGALVAPGCRFGAVYIPMDKVGGDFYDHTWTDGSIRLFIADVSGHGLPGAFLATVTKVALDGITERPAAAGVLLKLNDSICRATVRNNYVTAFYCIIDQEMRRVRYCSAGHLPQFLHRKRTGECLPMKTPGMPLGWFGDIRLVEGSMDLEPGDRLVLYTDGIVECVNPKGEMFGEERFISFISGNGHIPPQDFLDALIGEIKAFTGGAVFYDDITCMVLDLPGAGVTAP